MIIHNFDQRSDEWHNIRLGKFTGSNFHSFMKPSETRKRLILEKTAELITGISQSKRIVTDDMQRGIDLEDEAILAYELTTGNIVEKVGFIEKDKYTGCSPDGLVGSDGIIEAKSPKDSVYIKQVISKKIDPVYYTQMQYNLFISERVWCDYIAYNVNFNPYIVRYERDEPYIKEISIVLDQCIREVEENIKIFNERRIK